jgi:hypothetical protein
MMRVFGCAFSATGEPGAGKSFEAAVAMMAAEKTNASRRGVRLGEERGDGFFFSCVAMNAAVSVRGFFRMDGVGLSRKDGVSDGVSSNSDAVPALTSRPGW